MSSYSAYVPPFTTGSILGTGFGTLFSRFGPIVVASALVHLPLLVFFVVATPEAIIDYATTPLLSTAVNLLMSFVLAGVLSVLVVSALKDARTGVGSAFLAALKRLHSIIGVTLLLGIVIAVPAGILAFIGVQLGMAGAIVMMIAAVVVAVVLAAQFFVALPVAVLERQDMISALGTSSDLTRGHRLSIIGAMIVVAIITGVIGFLSGKIIEHSVETLDGVKNAMYVAIGIETLIGTIGPVLSAAAYYLLAEPEGRLEGAFE